MPPDSLSETDEWIVTYRPQDDRVRSDIKETIRYMDEHARRSQLAAEEEDSGVFQGQTVSIEWIKHDGAWNMIAKLKYSDINYETLMKRFQSIHEAACFAAVQTWHYQYGRKVRVGGAKNMECYCDLKNQEESFLFVELLSASHLEYRADLTLVDRHGRVLARWEEISGKRLE